MNKSAPPAYYAEEPSSEFLLTKLSRKWELEDDMLRKAAEQQVVILTQQTNEVISNLHNQLQNDTEEVRKRLSVHLGQKHDIRAQQIDRVTSNQMLNPENLNTSSWFWKAFCYIYQK